MTRDLLRMAEATGWTVSRTRGDHLKLVHPDADRPVFAASTPSCPRALANTLATMKRVLPPEPKPASTPKPKRRAKPQPGKHQIEQAVEMYRPPEPPRPRRPLPGGPASFVTTRWP